jgi:polyferredoxin
VSHRSLLIADVLRDRNALYRQAGDGAIENSYTLKLANKTDRAQRYRVTLEGAPAGVVLETDASAIAAGAGAVVSLPIVIQAPDSIRGRHALRFVVQSRDGSQRAVVDSSFFGPM